MIAVLRGLHRREHGAVQQVTLQWVLRQQLCLAIIHGQGPERPHYAGFCPSVFGAVQ